MLCLTQQRHEVLFITIKKKYLGGHVGQRRRAQVPAASPAPVRDAHQQRAALIARAFEVSHVPEMQQVETAVGDDQLPSACAHGRAPLRQLLPSDDFLAEIHGAILAEGFPVWQRLSKPKRGQIAAVNPAFRRS